MDIGAFFNTVYELLRHPWHWAFSGALIATVMLLLLLFNKSFGMSNTMRTICSIAGAGQKYSFFKFNWKIQKWNLAFMVGTAIGGLIASNFLASPEPVQISAATISHLQEWGVQAPSGKGSGFIPTDIFNFASLLSLKGFLLIVIGGFLIGFGARWAGGCTSGHAISGLSNLQLPSLIAVIGFFIGGLIMTHLLLPLIMQLGN